MPDKDRQGLNCLLLVSLIEGKSVDIISKEMGIKKSTIYAQRRRIKQKTGMDIKELVQILRPRAELTQNTSNKGKKHEMDILKEKLADPGFLRLAYIADTGDLSRYTKLKAAIEGVGNQKILWQKRGEKLKMLSASSHGYNVIAISEKFAENVRDYLSHWKINPIMMENGTRYYILKDGLGFILNRLSRLFPGSLEK